MCARSVDINGSQGDRIMEPSSSESFIKEFACKTKMNYYNFLTYNGFEDCSQQIVTLKNFMINNGYDSKDAYEVTFLINSLVGLLILPKENYYHYIRRRYRNFDYFPELQRSISQNNATSNEMEYINTYENEQNVTPIQIINHMRNSISHSRLELRPMPYNKNQRITHICFKDENDSGKEFQIVLSIQDLRKTAIRLCNYINEIGEDSTNSEVVSIASDNLVRSLVHDNIIYLPVVEQRASAGIGIETSQISEFYDVRSFLKDMIPAGATHAIIIDGHSMEPKIFDKQLAFIEYGRVCDDGDCGIFAVTTDGETEIYCKECRYDPSGKMYLHSINKAMDDPVFNENQEVVVRCIGRIFI